MIKKLFSYLMVAVAALALVIALRPAEFSIERKARIAAPPSAVYPHVADFRRWEAWSPWAKLDPGMKSSTDGQQGAAGASYSWDGNKEVGAGKMTIIEVKAPESVRIKLEFLKPFEATNDTQFTLTADGEGTLVVWRMSGKNGFISKAYDLFMGMDKLVGADFEKGLARLKTVAEAKAAR